MEKWYQVELSKKKIKKFVAVIDFGIKGIY